MKEGIKMGQLDKKGALITGGGSGIGQAIAQRFAKEGAYVVITGRREEPLKQTALANQKISYVTGDITNSQDVEKIMNYIQDHFHGQLDILVNNAGWCPVQSIKDMTIEDYDQAFALDVRALVDLTIQSLPLLLKTKGNIINLSSVGAQHTNYQLSMYVGAKAAVENFTRAWALDLAQDGVRVNAIAPGAIRTNIWNSTNLSEEERAHEKRITDTIPVKRFGQAQEVANVALFLASDEASYVTGSVYAVDGGQGSF